MKEQIINTIRNQPDKKWFIAEFCQAMSSYSIHIIRENLCALVKEGVLKRSAWGVYSLRELD